MYKVKTFLQLPMAENQIHIQTQINDFLANNKVTPIDVNVSLGTTSNGLLVSVFGTLLYKEEE